MRSLRLVLEYDGSGFHGWQKQPDQRTIQGELEETLKTVLGSPVSVPIASGRTDTGVHARRQVVTFQAETDEIDLLKLRIGVSSILRNELRIISAEEVSPEFHPIRDAIKKQYSYQVFNSKTPPVLYREQAKHVSQELNLQKMQDGANLLLGEHDFSSFRASGCSAKSPIRNIYEAEVSRVSDVVTFRFVGSGFLKQMVRNLVGTLLLIGGGDGDESTITEILLAKDRTAAGPTVEPYGLFLDWVEYPEGRL